MEATEILLNYESISRKSCVEPVVSGRRFGRLVHAMKNSFFPFTMVKKQLFPRLTRQCNFPRFMGSESGQEELNT